MNLKKHGLLARCTTKENVKHFPTVMAYKKSHTSHYGRGAYRMASEK